VACRQSSSAAEQQSSRAAEQQSSRAPACDGDQRMRELEADGMDWRAAHRHGDTAGTTLGHSLASLAHTAGPPGARRLALTGPRLGAFIFDVVPCKKRLVRGKIAARFPTPRRSCDRRRRGSSSWLSLHVGAASPRHNCLRLHQVPGKCQRPSSDRQRCPARRVNVTGCASAAFQAPIAC
jgi:hypothetical protein